jgi:hypothetical protein
MKAGRVELDYVAPPRRPLWLGIAVLAAALAAAADLGLRRHAAHRELTALAAVQGARDVPPERNAARGGEEGVKQAESVLRQLTLPWSDTVRAIEAASMREVGVLNMQPDAQQRVLRLTAEAKSREAMLEYVRRIAQTKGLSDVYIVNHEVQTEDPSRPIKFAVQASLAGPKRGSE